MSQAAVLHQVFSYFALGLAGSSIILCGPRAAVLAEPSINVHGPSAAHPKDQRARLARRPAASLVQVWRPPEPFEGGGAHRSRTPSATFPRASLGVRGRRRPRQPPTGDDRRGVEGPATTTAGSRPSPEVRPRTGLRKSSLRRRRGRPRRRGRRPIAGGSPPPRAAVSTPGKSARLRAGIAGASRHRLAYADLPARPSIANDPVSDSPARADPSFRRPPASISARSAARRKLSREVGSRHAV